MEESTIQKALRSWVRRSSGLDDKNIIWAQQGNVQPKGQFITMRMGDLIPLGACDEESHAYDDEAEPPAEGEVGTEITISLNGRRQFSLSVQVFEDGDLSAYSLLSKVQTSVGLPSYRDDLDAADLSCFDIGQVQNITALSETVFEPRAQCDLTFYCSETASEQTTFVETVEAENDLKDPPTILEIP